MEQSTRTRLEVTLGSDGQLLLPAEVWEELGINAGDRLVLSMAEDGLLVRSKRASALAALREIQRAFAESGISEEEWQAEGRRVREEISRERYGED